MCYFVRAYLCHQHACYVRYIRTCLCSHVFLISYVHSHIHTHSHTHMHARTPVLLSACRNGLFSTAATLAHELGHNFNLLHDTSICHTTATGTQGIMSSSFGPNMSPFYWSSCSVYQFNDFVATGGGCVLIPGSANKHSILGSQVHLLHTHIHACMCIYGVFTYAYIYINVCMYVCMYVCKPICMCVELSYAGPKSPLFPCCRLT